MMDWFLDRCPVDKDSRVLDLGSGSGVVLDALKDRGFNPMLLIVSNLLYEDVIACKQKGYQCWIVDINHIAAPHCTIEQQVYGLVTARHSLEHCFSVDFVLAQIHQLLKPEGYLYIEVPAPGTAAHHESDNDGHLSVFTLEAWLAKIKRAGFRIIDSATIHLELACGPDQYYAFAAQKP